MAAIPFVYEGFDSKFGLWVPVSTTNTGEYVLGKLRISNNCMQGISDFPKTGAKVDSRVVQ